MGREGRWREEGKSDKATRQGWRRVYVLAAVNKTAEPWIFVRAEVGCSRQSATSDLAPRIWLRWHDRLDNRMTGDCKLVVKSAGHSFEKVDKIQYKTMAGDGMLMSRSGLCLPARRNCRAER